MILSDAEILASIEWGDIVTEPYDRECPGTNSYDLLLSKHLATCRNRFSPRCAGFSLP